MAKQYRVFCARCQDETPHNGALVSDEIILTCTNLISVTVKDEAGEESVQSQPCGRALKVSTALSSDDIKSFLITHEVSNRGQVPIDEEALAKELAVTEQKMEQGLSEFEIN